MTAPQECPLTQQAVGWALHSLEPDEEMAVLLHLPQCTTCRAAAHDAEQVLTGLGGLVPQVEPPAGLRDRLMAEVAETPQRPPVLRPRQPEPAEAAPQPSRLHRLDAEEARPARWFARGSRGRRLVAASLVAAAVLSFGGLAIRTTQLEQQRAVESAQAQSLSELFSELGRPGTEYALLVDQASGATVAAVVVRDGEREVYSVALPANTAEQIYVAWGLRDDGSAPVPLATFDVTSAEQGPLPVGSVAEDEGFAQYAVSIEPGRIAPTSPSTVVAIGGVTI